jgi:hypothetical protein
VRGATPKPKTFNVKILSHSYSLIAKDFSCNRRNTDGVGVHAARAVAGKGSLVAGLQAEAAWHRHPADGPSDIIGKDADATFRRSLL